MVGYISRTMGTFRSAKLLFLLISASQFLDIIYGSSQELSFTMNVTGHRPNLSAIYKGNDVLLTCSTKAGHSYALRITRSRINETVSVNMATESTVTLNLRNISCDKMDRYVCEGPGGETASLDVGIYNCDPVLCPGEKNFNTIFAYLYHTKNVSFCVIAYPNISHTAKHNDKSIRTNERLNDSRWRWVSEKRSFSTYTVRVTISNISKEDYGKHILTFSTSQLGKKNLEYTIYLRPPDKPDCPTNIMVKGTGMDYITLSWKPGLDGGSKQTFNVSYSSSASVSVMVPSTDSTSCNITGLEPDTAYNFTVQVIPKNKNGSNWTCGSIQVGARTKTKTAPTYSANAVTSAPSTSPSIDTAVPTTRSSSENDLITVVLPVVCVLGVLIIAAVVICLIVYMKISKLYTNLWRPEVSRRQRSQPRVQYIPYARSTETVDTGAQESLMTTTTSLGDTSITNDSGRTISDQGLIYVTVDHGSNTRRAEPRNDSRNRQKVEYSTLNFAKSGKYSMNNLNEYKSTQHSKEKIYANA